MDTEIVKSQEKDIAHRAASVLQSGGLVAFPTDTVYGVAALTWQTAAVARLYQVKQRPQSRPIPLLLSDQAQVEQVAYLTDRWVPLATQFWPGGLTLVLPKHERVPDIVSLGPTVAVRVPGLDLSREIIRHAGGVLAVTSANLSGQPSPVTAQEVAAQLGGQIEMIVDGGPCPQGIASTILDCTQTPPRVLRSGAIAETALRAAIGEMATESKENT